MTRTQLLVLCLTLLAAVAVGWIARSGLWRRHRVALVGAALVVGLLALTRRLGWQELAFVVAVIAAALLTAPRGRGRSAR